ncbi:MAG TPA: sulfatase [Gemmatimonadaceae bacterium]
MRHRLSSQLADALRIVAACALIAAVGQVARNVYLHYLRDTFAWASRDAVWMAPIAFSLLFGAVAVALLLAGRLYAPFSAPWTLAGVCGGLASYSLVSQFPGIHPYAVLVLAVGVGARLGTAVRTRLEWWRRAFGRTGLVLGAGLLVLAVGDRGGRVLREQRFLANAPAPPPSAPNVLLIILDTVRRANMSLYGYARETTPNIDRLAQESTVFDWAIAPSSWTLPSHAAMFTGRRPTELGVSWRDPMGASERTLTEALRDRGYATGGFAANLYYTTWESGLAQGFIRYTDYRTTIEQALLSANLVQVPIVRRLLWARSLADVADAFRRFDLRIPSDPWAHEWQSPDMARAFLQWQDGLGERPFFAFVNLFGAHDQDRVPEPWRSRFSATPTPMDLYDGGIAMVDAAVGMILDSLRARGVLDRTLVIITSDHGEHLGERGLRSHGASLYLPVLRVPLLVRLPGRVPPGERIRTPVTLADLPASVMDRLGIADHGFAAPSWFAADRRHDDAVLSEVGRSENPQTPAGRGALYSLITSDFHYIHSVTGEEELYDLRSDPAGSRNVAQEPAYRAVLADLRARLAARAPEILTPP